jgi:HEPN domain-containing protein
MSSTNNNIKEAQRWLNQARYDLQSAYHSSGGEFYSTACFQAQQAAEKALKALLIRRGRRGLLSHSTLQLIKELANENEDILAYTKHARINRWWRTSMLYLKKQTSHPPIYWWGILLAD